MTTDTPSTSPPDAVTCPRYVAWVSTTQFYICETLVEAMGWRKRTGAIVYEPLGMTTAEKVAAEPPDAVADLIGDFRALKRDCFRNDEVYDLCCGLADALESCRTEIAALRAERDALRSTLDILADPRAMKMFNASLEDIKAGRLHDHEDVKAELSPEQP